MALCCVPGPKQVVIYDHSATAMQEASEKPEKVPVPVRLAEKGCRSMAFRQHIAIIAAQEQERDTAAGERIRHGDAGFSVQVQIEHGGINRHSLELGNCAGDRTKWTHHDTAARRERGVEVQRQKRVILDDEHAHPFKRDRAPTSLQFIAWHTSDRSRAG